MNIETLENTVINTESSGVHLKSKVVPVSQKDGRDTANAEQSDIKMENSSTKNIEQSVSQSDEIGKIFAEQKPEDAGTQRSDELVEKILHGAKKLEKAMEPVSDMKNEEANAHTNNISAEIEDMGISAEPVSPNATESTEHKTGDAHSEVRSDTVITSAEAKTENVQADSNPSEKKDIPTETEAVNTTSETTSSEVAKTNETKVASVDEVKSEDVMTKEPEMVMQRKENVTIKNIVPDAQTEEPIPLVPDASKELNEVKGLTEKLSTTVKTIALAREALDTVVKKQKGMQ